MKEYYLSVTLHSEATFGRGEGLAGLVDVEIEHDLAGMPFISGRSLKGLLVEEWANLRFALYGRTDEPQPLDDVAMQLFGVSGIPEQSDRSLMHVSAAELPRDLRHALAESLSKKQVTPSQILASLTTIRRQTSIDASHGAPQTNSLRAMRALMRGTTLIASLAFRQEPDERALALLAACILAVRRGGSGRNRGRGRLAFLLHDTMPTDGLDATFTQTWFNRFAAEVMA